jgi:hypothetical protein
MLVLLFANPQDIAMVCHSAAVTNRFHVVVIGLFSMLGAALKSDCMVCNRYDKQRVVCIGGLLSRGRPVTLC